MKIKAENIDKKLNSYLYAQHVLDHIVEKPKEGASTSTDYKSCPPPVLFENHNFDMVEKDDLLSESVGASSNMADPYSDKRPVLGQNDECVEAMTDTESDDDSVEKSKSEVENPLENHILCDPKPKTQKC